MVKSLFPAILLLSTLTACISVPRTIASVTPQRPTLSSDTSTTAPGTSEIEAGISLDDDGNFDSPVLLKYGVSPITEVFVGASPLRIADSPGRDDRGVGDAWFGLRSRLREETAYVPSVAAQIAVKLPVANEDHGLGSGETDVLFAAMAGHQIEDWYLVGFYQLGLLGEVGDGGMDIEHDLAVAGSRPLEPDLALFGEVAGQFVPELDIESVFTTWGVAYMLHPSIVVDVALALGISNDAPDAALLVGFTRNFGHVVRYRPR